jgi:DNA (cytosine-5)-methyltransferase 1
MPLRTSPTLISLFTGAGGLDLGLEAAGFQHKLCVELDEDCRATLSLNRPKWKLATPGDILALPAKELMRQAGVRRKELTLLAGGPPCQPFSKAALWASGAVKRMRDPRAATIHAYLNVVEATLPKVLLLENVRGLSHGRTHNGLQSLKRGLGAINRRHGTGYVLNEIMVDAADYGVPQHRERLFLIASRDGRSFEMPEPQYGPGRRYNFTSVWDAIGDLDSPDWESELRPSGKWANLLPSIPEGTNYGWHTAKGGGQPLFGWRTRYWAFLLKLSRSEPSWTISAQPGPAAGPFHWRSRLLSPRELCRLQTFPDNYQIVGDRRAVQKQVGNAVPCAIAHLMGQEIRRQMLDQTRVRRKAVFLPNRLLTLLPSPILPSSLPEEFHVLRGSYAPHPGTGKGPGAVKRLRAKIA